jgi:hypothetical protein
MCDHTIGSSDPGPPRPVLAEGTDRLRGGGVTRGADEAHLDPATLARRNVSNVHCSVVQARDGAGNTVTERLAGRRQGDPARGAVKQLDAELAQGAIMDSIEYVVVGAGLSGAATA